MEAAGGLAQRKRTIEREGVAGAAAIPLRGDHIDLADLAEGRGKSLQTGGKITVVVAQQNTHWGNRNQALQERCRPAWTRVPNGARPEETTACGRP